ncbi:MAG: hypothetical protein Q8L47_03860 [bacterium]|nr:hypothetical protein [bacterium]
MTEGFNEGAINNNEIETLKNRIRILHTDLKSVQERWEVVYRDPNASDYNAAMEAMDSARKNLNDEAKKLDAIMGDKKGLEFILSLG